MRCPACGHVVQHVDRACLRCGVELLPALERRAWGGLTRRRRSGGPRPSRRPLAAAGAGLALGTVLLLAAWLFSERGRAPELPPQAFHDSVGGLAFLPPPGWALRADPVSGVRLLRVAELSGPGGRIVVETAAAGVPLSGHIGALVREEFNGRRPRLEAAAGFLVDGAEARRLAFRADAGSGRPPIAGEAVAFPGLGRSYLIRFYSDAERFSSTKPVWNAFLASLSLRRGG
jgi:hypothetical protein